MEMGQFCLKEVLCFPLMLVYQSWNFLPVCSGISTVKDYKIAQSQKAVKLAEHWIDKVENLLCEESQGQKTRKAGEITEAIKEIMLNSALL